MPQHLTPASPADAGPDATRAVLEQMQGAILAALGSLEVFIDTLETTGRGDAAHRSATERWAS